jgi:uncharacterized protein
MQVLIVCIMLLFSASFAWGASFDCQKAVSHSEKLICSNTQLSQLDEDLAQSYKIARQISNKEQLKKEQIRWLKRERNACQDVACLIQAYQRRITELDSLYSLYTGEYALEDDDDYCSGGMTVTQKQRKLSVSVETVCGPSYHTCDFEGSGTIRNGTAVLASPDDPTEKVTALFHGNMAEIHQASQLWCGLNASMVGTYVRRTSSSPSNGATASSAPPAPQKAAEETPTDQPRMVPLDALLTRFAHLTKLQQEQWNTQHQWEHQVQGVGVVSEAQEVNFFSEMQDMAYEVTLELSDTNRAVLFLPADQKALVLNLEVGSRVEFQGRLKKMQDWGFWRSAYVKIE